MDGLFSFLLFAGLFYFMMRVGCGSHTIHGHSHGHGKNQRDSRGMTRAIDPVCGKSLSDDEGYGKMHNGSLYRFCSQKCLQTFESHSAEFTEESVKTLDNNRGHDK